MSDTRHQVQLHKEPPFRVQHGLVGIRLLSVALGMLDTNMSVLDIQDDTVCVHGFVPIHLIVAPSQTLTESDSNDLNVGKVGTTAPPVIGESSFFRWKIVDNHNICSPQATSAKFSRKEHLDSTVSP